MRRGRNVPGRSRAQERPDRTPADLSLGCLDPAPCALGLLRADTRFAIRQEPALPARLEAVHRGTTSRPRAERSPHLAAITSHPADLGHAPGFGPDGSGPNPGACPRSAGRSEEHTSELQSPCNIVCRLLL